MRRLVLLLVIGAWALPGCNISPPPKADHMEFDRKMNDLNAEVLRQEGKLKP